MLRDSTTPIRRYIARLKSPNSNKTKQHRRAISKGYPNRARLRIRAVCPWMFIPLILFMVLSRESRDFHLDLQESWDLCGSWVAVKPNGTWLPSRLNPGWLGALLPSPSRVDMETISLPKQH